MGAVRPAREAVDGTARLCDLRSSDTVYVPGMEDARHAKLLEGWAEAVKRTMAR